MAPRMGVASGADGVRGLVEVRGPQLISGWAWRADGPPLTLLFRLNGEVCGSCVADRMRPELADAGMGDGHVGFSWIIPDGLLRVDPAAIEVLDEQTGAWLPDAA